MQKFHVNHSENEFTRSVEAIVDVETKKTEVLLSGTQAIDHEWSLMKDEIPRNMSCKTDEGRTLMGEHWRAAQWRRMANAADKWAAFCKAAQQHAHQQIAERLITPQMQDLDADHEDEAAMTDKARAVEQEPAEAVLDMVKSLNVGELERLEPAIAARKATAQHAGTPLTAL